MAKFFLEEPTMSREKDVVEYIEEHQKYNSNYSGVGFFDCILYGDSYYNCLIKTNNLENEEYAKKIDMCPGKAYLLIRDSDNKAIGMINIRHNLNEKMKKFGGNIGFGIRPTERHKGYGKIAVYLALKKAYDYFNLEEVMVDTPESNIEGNKIAIDFGAQLDRSEINSANNQLTNVYHINTKDAIYKYKNAFEDKIIEK